jgi:hypothetical protein
MPVLRNILVAFLLTVAGTAAAEDDLREWCFPSAESPAYADQTKPTRAYCRGRIQHTNQRYKELKADLRRGGIGWNFGKVDAACSIYCHSRFPDLPLHPDLE